MKTRAVVWTVIGVVVLVGVIFLVATGRRPPASSIEGALRQVEVVSGRLGELERRVADSRAGLQPGQDPSAFDAIAQQIADARGVLNEARQAEKLDAVMTKLTDARTAYSSALRQYRKLTRQPRR
ncbi:MAG TPA: hypothetical protein ENN51_00295 [candidate division WOR-3 bacterium]|uniref:Uncharacterized protein n=1 Tax=candidate division WOR-3 bacterium TaxID=2052148 RepID=A0A7V0T4G2_UNCW3|nr:hypothetical protein [candidate division WOR-3 bacterium]